MGRSTRGRNNRPRESLFHQFTAARSEILQDLELVAKCARKRAISGTTEFCLLTAVEHVLKARESREHLDSGDDVACAEVVWMQTSCSPAAAALYPSTVVQTQPDVLRAS